MLLTSKAVYFMGEMVGPATEAGGKIIGQEASVLSVDPVDMFAADEHTLGVLLEDKIMYVDLHHLSPAEGGGDALRELSGSHKREMREHNYGMVPGRELAFA